MARLKKLSECKRVEGWLARADGTANKGYVYKVAAGLVLLDLQARVKSGEMGNVMWEAWYESQSPSVGHRQAAKLMKDATTASDTSLEAAKMVVTKTKDGNSVPMMSNRNDPVEAVKRACNRLTTDDQRRDVLAWVNEIYGGLHVTY
jgi:hypothetical protein